MSRFQGQRVGGRRRDGRRRPRRHASYLFLELEFLVDAGARRRAGSNLRWGRRPRFCGTGASFWRVLGGPKRAQPDGARILPVYEIATCAELRRPLAPLRRGRELAGTC